MTLKQLPLSLNLDTHNLPDLLYTEAVYYMPSEQRRVVKDSWSVQEFNGKDLPAVEASEQSESYSTWFLDETGPSGRYSAFLEVHGSSLSLEVAGDPVPRDRFVEWMRKTYPPIEVEGDNVPVTFWFGGKNGPNSSTRKIGATRWQAIENNYGSDTQEQLRSMMKGAGMAQAGLLYLWSGSPGTGKTWAIRALIREWREWCSAHYVVDPEAFFGGPAQYVMSVLLSPDRPGHRPWHDDDDDPEKEKWRLFIFEDTGELLSIDAKERVGQGLSRLLNITDGLIGQGLKVMLLVTTNEEIGRMHPAVTRAGRNAADVRFSELSHNEALNWADEHGVSLPDRARSSYTLADLYAIEAGRKVKPKALMGFSMSGNGKKRG